MIWNIPYIINTVCMKGWDHHMISAFFAGACGMDAKQVDYLIGKLTQGVSVNHSAVLIL